MDAFRVSAAHNVIWCRKVSLFTHPNSGSKYRIPSYHTCQSSYVIYLLICQCSLLYVGETTQKIKDQLVQHRCSIRGKQPGLLVAKHFTECDHKDTNFKFIVLEEISKNRRGGDRILNLKQRSLVVQSMKYLTSLCFKQRLWFVPFSIRDLRIKNLYICFTWILTLYIFIDV